MSEPLDTYDYDAFGNMLNSSGSTPNVYKYRGEQWDSDLSLYYLRARYYNPITGTFMSRDPQQGLNFRPITLHKYLYAGGNPTNWIDPSGRDAFVSFGLRVEKDFTAVQYLNTISCFANIMLTAASEELDVGGLAATTYGCLTISWSPAGELTRWFKSGLDLGACAYAAYVAIDDANSFSIPLTPAHERQLTLDAITGVLGCGVTGIGAALEE